MTTSDFKQIVNDGPGCTPLGNINYVGNRRVPEREFSALNSLCLQHTPIRCLKNRETVFMNCSAEYPRPPLRPIGSNTDILYSNASNPALRAADYWNI